MDLSVIIVNYNVRYYLEQCLSSLSKALDGIEAEVFVVDNSSVDGSAEMVKTKFPEVQFIANQDNVGFSRANNQALKIAKGRYALLLNPDTVVAEDSIKKVIQFMDVHPEAGGVGVRMVDGKGRFLPESKRGLPTPSVAFFKISGLSRIFPKSKIFAKYHLGHLPEHKVNEIEILSGACMFLRQSTLEKVGVLDNSFFMYGEDIDLSYRITLGGYKNYYFPEAQLIHYKGESTKKSSFNYVYVFYNAMAIFARKHFTKKGSGLFAFLIDLAIYASAGAALLARTLYRLILPISDALIVLGGALPLSKFLNDSSSSDVIFEWGPIHLFCLLIWILSIGLFGGYDKPIRLLSIVKGTLFGSLIIALLIPISSGVGKISYTFLLITSIWTFIAFTFSRVLLHLLKVDGYSLRAKNKKRFLVVGEREEAKRVSDLIWQINYGVGLVEILDPEMTKGSLAENIDDERKSKKIDSIVFCAQNVSDKKIIDLIQKGPRAGVEYKIARPGCEYLISSNSIESLNDLFILDLNSVRLASNKRNKRVLDTTISLLLIASLPLTIWFVSNKSAYVRNLFRVLRGHSTWVGYNRGSNVEWKDLPHLRPPVLDPSVEITPEFRQPELIRRCNIIYAKDYSVWNDLKMIFGHFSELGGQRA